MQTQYAVLPGILVLASRLAFASAVDGQRPPAAMPQLTFEENLGQTDRQYGFVAQTPRAQIALNALGLSLDQAGSPTLLIHLVGGDPQAHPQALEPSPARSHYFRGASASAWIVGARHFGRIAYQSVYPGVDVAYYGKDGRFEYDFIVAPKGDANRIRLRLEGASRVEISPEGDALVTLGSSTLRQLRPAAYQDSLSGRRAVAVRYAQRGPRDLTFVLGPHDRRRPVTIDPAIAFSTYLGSSSWDEGNSVAVDAAGNAYVAGLTTASGGKDVSVAKFSPTGQLLYRTVFGGNHADGATGIAVDASGNAYVTGWTWSWEFPVQNYYSNFYSGSYEDGFVTKLDPNGVILYSTYLPGNGEDHPNAIAVDGAGNAYVAGRTSSTDFPTTSASQASSGGGDDAFVLKLSAAGNSLLFSTYLGGTASDAAKGIAVANGTVYVAGATSSFDFPTRDPYQAAFGGGAEDAFVAKLNAASGALLYSTYLGNANHESGQSIAVDSSGAVFVTGWVLKFPPALFGWVAGLTPDGQSLTYSIEGRGGEAVRVDAADQAYVTGQAGYFYSKISPAGSVLADVEGIGGNGLALTGAGDVVVTGSTDQTSLPTVNAYQPTHADAGNSEPYYGALVRRWDAFVTRITDGPTPTPSATSAATPSPTTTPRPTATATTTSVPTATRTPTSTAGPTPTATSTPRPTATVTATATPRATPRATPTGTTGTTPTTATATPRMTATATPTPVVTARPTPTPTAGATPTPTGSVLPGNPFGYFDTPVDGSTHVSGAIAVTGWALDDTLVSRVDIYRDPVAGDAPPSPNGKIFIGSATFVAGARPDVAAAFPNYPFANRAAWGYRLLTNLLPDVAAHAAVGGNGTFTLYAYAIDPDGNFTLLGARSFTAQNTGATKPFGTIDTPGQGETVSGIINNFGWVLTPPPSVVPKDGSTIRLFIDGVARGTAEYNLYRSDIATLFPGYANSGGAVGLFTIDTRTLANGVHTIAWSATDNAGHADGIGSRYFTVQN